MKDLRFFTQEYRGTMGDLFVEPRYGRRTSHLWFMVGRSRDNGRSGDDTVLDREQVIKLRDELTLWIDGRDERPAPPKKWEEL